METPEGAGDKGAASGSWIGDEGELQRSWDVDQVIDVTCQLAKRDAIGSVHIATPRRPTYAQLMRYRRRAAACGLTLEVTSTSMILHSPTPEGFAWNAPRASLAWRGHDPGHRSALLRHLSTRAKAWWFEMKTLNEGTQ